MAATRSAMFGRLITRSTLRPKISDSLFRTPSEATGLVGPDWPASMANVRFASTKPGGGNMKYKNRFQEVQRLLYQAEERYKAGGGVEPIPKITLDHVSIGYARSGGSGGQAFSKVNTKVDMRFNVKNAHWLDEKVRERIMQMEKKRITKDGEIVISSSKTRTQQGNNVEDAKAKLQVFTYQKKKLQAIIDAASYAPLPPSEGMKKKITYLSTLGEQKVLEKKKGQSQKKASRRNREGDDLSCGSNH